MVTNKDKKKKKIPLKEQGVLKRFDKDPTTGERSAFIASGGKDSTATVINPNEETAAFGQQRAEAIHAENEARKTALGELQFIVAAAEKGIIDTKQAGRLAREIQDKTQPQQAEQIPEGRETKTKGGLTGFMQNLPGGRSDQDIEKNLAMIEERGEFKMEDLPEAALDAALLGGGAEIAATGLKAGAKAITGIRGTKAATMGGKELGKLSKVRKEAITNLLKGTKRTGDPVVDAINRELSAVKLSQMMRLGKGKMGTDAAVRAINSFNKWDKTKIMSFLAKKPVVWTAKTYAALAGADVIWTWFALDNISTGLKFTVSQVEEGLSQGMSMAEAEELFTEADIAFDAAMWKIKWSNRLNIFLWASSKLLRKGAEVNKLEYELRKANLIGR